MKTRNYINIKITILTLLFINFTGCKEEWLDSDPLSFYEPSVTFTTEAGLESALTTCNRQLRHYFMAEAAPYYTDLLFSDVAVDGTTDKSGPAQDINTLVTPSANNYSDDTNKINFFWYEGFAGVKYANAVISNIDEVKGLDDDTYGEMLGRAYFHRAWRYYHLVFQFGDIPLITQDVSSPKLDYQSTKMSVIIDKMISDLEYAVVNVPENEDFGKTNKGACRMLLMKYYLAAGEFDKAIEQADMLIDNSSYALMTSNFGTFLNSNGDVHNVTENVIWDLHRPENKAISTNTEGIKVMISRYDYSESRQSTSTMRNCVPFWSGSGTTHIRTPLGKIRAMTNNVNDEVDLRRTYGRGIARSRPTLYAEESIWSDDNDLRHSRSEGNWVAMEDLIYNNSSIKGGVDASYYGQNISKYNDNGDLLCIDTIRCWFGWPHYKIWIEDPANENTSRYDGGPGDWYLYRLAEAYLLRAEAYFWKGEYQKAADDINQIRERAHCTKLYNAADIDMGVIMDERARELSFEEYRHVEMVRISYIFAQQGVADEYGNSYSFSTPADLSQSSYWYARMEKYNNFYNKGVTTVYGAEYTISPYHIFWPVPQDEIDANLYGIINQNYGYYGYENNVDPYNNLDDAINAANN